MAATQLMATFKKEEREYDGLSDEEVRKLFLGKPLEMFVGVALFQPVEKVEDFRDGSIRPRVRLHHSEIVLDGDDAKQVMAILNRRYKERTGREVPEDLFTTASTVDDD